MSRTSYLALFALAYYSGVLLITAPASLLDLPIRHLSGERLSLANSQGSIWQGSATPVLHIGKNSTIPLHTLNWQIRPQALLLGQLKVVTNWQQLKSDTPMELTINRKSIVLTNILLPLPAEMIGELSPFLKPAQFSGNLVIESPRLTYTYSHLQGNATARWNQAGSAMSSVNPLGDYQIDIVAAQEGLQTTLSTQAGALLLNGQGSWSPAQGFHFTGTAQATADTKATLAELLHHLGPEVSPEIYQITL